MNQKIFVSIASYRDPELPKTVHDLISKAEFPQLLKIVVYEQNDITDPTISGMYTQVLLLKDHYSLAKGPNWARAKIQKEYTGEEYYLQLDSHTRAVNNWDTILKHMLDLLPVPSVITQYPSEYDLTETTYPDKVRSGLYIQGFGTKDRFTRIQSNLAIGRHYYPYTSKAWSACFSFSKGDIVKDGPYDQTFEHLFFGEELDITLKLYTRGYYFFSPHIPVFYTHFKRNYRRTYWEDIPVSERSEKEEESRNRLWRRILNNEVGPDALGTTRTVKDYMKFADIDSFLGSIMNKKAKTFRTKTKRELFR